MGFKLGIVGLPNVGKSTLFNALTESSKAQSANYPFCTVEPNVGVVEVPDDRLYTIAQREGSEKATPAFIEFVDIAGLVKGASKGEGLGNQFLSHIREVDAIALVLRCFENPQIVHVEGNIDPVRDAQIVDLELIAKDFETVSKRLEKVEKIAKSGDKEAKKEFEYLKILKELLENLEPIRKYTESLPPETLHYASDKLFLLTAKPIMFIANIDEKDLPDGKNNPHLQKLLEKAHKEKIPLITVCAKLEAELSSLGEEGKELLQAYGLKERGLHRVIREGYRLLNLITFFTTNQKETKAWTLVKGTKALKAAGKIHSDMEKGFIKAEVLNYEDYLKAGSMQKAKEKGLVRLEGKEYEVKDGDIIYFRFNVRK